MQYPPDVQVALRRFAQDEGQADGAMAAETDRVRGLLAPSRKPSSLAHIHAGDLAVRRRGVSFRRVAH